MANPVLNCKVQKHSRTLQWSLISDITKISNVTKITGVNITLDLTIIFQVQFSQEVKVVGGRF